MKQHKINVVYFPVTVFDGGAFVPGNELGRFERRHPLPHNPPQHKTSRGRPPGQGRGNTRLRHVQVSDLN